MIPPDVQLAPADAELWSLTAAMCDGTIAAEDLEHLEALLRASESARLFYAAYMDMHGRMLWRFRGATARTADDNVPHETTTVLCPTAAPPASIFGLLGESARGTAVFLSSGWPVAYLIATVVLGVGLVIGGITHVSQPVQVVQKTFPSPFGRGAGGEGRVDGDTARPPIVGQITGMVDCRFAEGSRFTVQGSGLPSPAGGRGAGGEGRPSPASRTPRPASLVHLGDEFALLSGLLEITYDTGARVILQGPVTYKVESPAGGFLSVGKLTARVEKKVASGQWPVGSKSEISNPQSLIPNPSLTTGHWPLFTVATPTATVTDLGTEFGVEVARSGETTSQVFRGSVRLQSLSASGQKQGDAIVLRENESARTEHIAGTGGASIVMRRVESDPRVFVRRLVRTPQTLDLLDVVAGGSGIGHRREHGIDASTGMQDPVFVTVERIGDGKYKSVDWHKLIDGTFVPNGKGGPVALDSAGHRFDGFPHTAGSVWGSIWARPADVKPSDDRVKDGDYYLYRNRNAECMPEGRGLLCMHCNAGITLNLEAMRKKYPSAWPARFRAVVGLLHHDGVADFWVLVDGHVAFNRMKLRQRDGVVPIDVELRSDNRFLTLATTDGGDGTVHDWVVFGDPVLDMASIERKE